MVPHLYRDAQRSRKRIEIATVTMQLDQVGEREKQPKRIRPRRNRCVHFELCIPDRIERLGDEARLLALTLNPNLR